MKRRAKLRKLTELYTKTKGEKEKWNIFEKVKKIAPQVIGRGVFRGAPSSPK